MIEAIKKRSELERIRINLDHERQSFISHWRDLSTHILPRRARFLSNENNQGEKRNRKIIDCTATMSSRTLQSGMMSGITSPSRPWFRLSLSAENADLSEKAAVKQWLAEVEKLMNSTFLKSNLYNVLPTLYGDLGTFGTGCMLIERDEDSVIRSYPFPIGSYYIAQNHKLQVDTFLREFELTVRQVVDKFGKKQGSTAIDFTNISETVKNFYESGHFENPIGIVHIIIPNKDYDPKSLRSDKKKYMSYYYEHGGGSRNSQTLQNSSTIGGPNKILSEKGYDLFPVLAPRWQVTAEDVYGTNCPGMVALGDIRQLQLGERRIAQAIEKMINPPMVGPSSLKNAKPSLIPGDITYMNERDGTASFRPVHEINFRVDLMEQKQSQIRDRIQRAYFADLFLMLANSDRRQITATEIEERREEKLLALGPVLEQLNQDLLDPLIDITFALLDEQGKLPPPPEEIAGRALKTEYISIMAQAQKLVGVGTVERFSGFAGNLLQLDQSVIDKIDLTKLIDVYGDLTSIPAGIVRTEEQVEEILAERQRQQEQLQEQQQAAQAIQNVKSLSEASTEDGNALSAIASQAGGLGG